MAILGIESSCDDTGVAIYCKKAGLLAHHVKSDPKTHERFGGIVPELASRDHIRFALPLIEQALKTASCSPKDIEAIAYTKGPGLMGSLLVGVTLAKSLGFAWGTPTIGIHHMEAHLLASWLSKPYPEPPFVALLVSGGHTMLVAVEAFGTYRILGASLDDAAGEAFDKTAKLLGLPYPGGPQVAKLALRGNPKRFQFPRPLRVRGNLNFSFSGLKTHTQTTVLSHLKSEQDKCDIARAFEDAVTDVLTFKCKEALDITNARQLVIAGGVSANLQLRANLQTMADARGVTLFYPPLEYCVDNGAMIALAGLCRLQTPDINHDIVALPRWDLGSLPPWESPFTP